jgi:hypothetical protein
MDMGELTRQELDTKLDAVKSWLGARFAEQQARIDVRFAEQDAKFEVRFAEQNARIAEQRHWMEAQFAEQRYLVEGRFAQLDAKMKGNVVQLIKWMVGMSFAMLALTVAIFGFMLNVAVTALTLGPTDNGADSNSTSARGGASSAVLLHRFQRHHQPRVVGRDARRHVLHAAEAQVFHPE